MSISASQISQFSATTPSYTKTPQDATRRAKVVVKRRLSDTNRMLTHSRRCRWRSQGFCEFSPLNLFIRDISYKKWAKGSPYSITERRVPEQIPVLGSQPAGNVSHKPGGRLPLPSARPAVTTTTLKRAGTNLSAW